MSSATISAFTAVALGSLPALKALMVAEGMTKALVNLLRVNIIILFNWALDGSMQQLNIKLL